MKLKTITQNRKKICRRNLNADPTSKKLPNLLRVVYIGIRHSDGGPSLIGFGIRNFDSDDQTERVT